MVSTFKAGLHAGISLTEQAAAVFGTTPGAQTAMEFVLSLGQGNIANTFSTAYMRERTVASNTNDDIDLAGVLASILGETVANVELVALMLINAPLPVNGVVTPNTTNLTVGGGSNPVVGFQATGDIIGPIRPGGVLFLASGDIAGLGVVTPTTGDILRIANSAGAPNTYQIGILGRTA